MVFICIVVEVQQKTSIYYPQLPTYPSIPFPSLLFTQLLGEMLLDRSNVKVMVKFVSEVPHLMQMMMLLKDQSRSIQFEAFHVFKVGVEYGQ